MNEDAVFYVGQKAFIKKGEEVLVLQDPHEGLDYPGGKIQEGETDLVKSLQREVREETGLEIIVGAPFATWTNIFPDHHVLKGKRVYLVGYRCEYVSGDVQLSNEHDTFSWITKENYQDADDGSAYFHILDKYFQGEMPQWVLPNFNSEQEKGELERVCRTFDSENPDILLRRFYENLGTMKIESLTARLLAQLENTDAGDVARDDFDRVDHHVKNGKYDDPENKRDWKYLKGKMEHGEELDMPVIVKIGDMYHLMSGNTRLMVARALGITPQVVIVDLGN